MNRFRSLYFFWVLLIFSHPFGPDKAPAADLTRKISPALQHRLVDYPAWPVIMVGSTQFLKHSNGFNRFCETNGGKKRSELRSTTLSRLKTLAEKEQSGILQALGNPEDAVRLWIINAIGVNLTREGVLKAAALESVQYIYADRGVPRVNGGGEEIAEVIASSNAGAFSLSDKKIPWYLEKIGAPAVWTELDVVGDGIVVALFDSGSDYRHSDLRNNLWINSDEHPNNGRDDDGNGYTDDYYGYNFVQGSPRVLADGQNQHGTWTSGIIAGDGAGGTQTGVAPRAELMQLIAGGSYCHAALALQYALEEGADVMNMSFSWPDLGQERGLIRRMMDHAVCAGLVTVSGAGNFGEGSQNPAPVPVQLRIPEGIPSVIAAGGLTRNLQVPSFASTGPVEWAAVRFYEDHPLPRGLIKPDVCGFTGPGYPLLNSETGKYVDPNTRIGGNSFSGAMISGVAALILSAAPELPAWRVKGILEETATPIGGGGKNVRTGTGLVNAFRAVQAARLEAGHSKGPVSSLK